MNKNNAIKYLPLVKALAEGKTIQIKSFDGQWFDQPHPGFVNPPETYRIKPEPIIKETWSNLYHNAYVGGTYTSLNSAHNYMTEKCIGSLHVVTEDGKFKSSTFIPL